MPKDPQHISISEAAEMLNQSIVQTRRWFDDGKLKGFRHPVNNYRRIYLSSVKQLQKSTKARGKVSIPKRSKKSKVA